MSRSVSCPYTATFMGYIYPELEDSDDFDWFVENLQMSLKEKFPSLIESSEWVGREDLCIVENENAKIGVSEYMGMICLWAIPNNNLGVHWIDQIKKTLNSYTNCYKVATFSNGEAVYEKKSVN